MKRMLLILTVLLGWSAAQADDYMPLLREGVKWVYTEEKHIENYAEDQTPSICESRFYTIEVNGDSVIDNVTYKKVFRYSDVEWDDDFVATCSRIVPNALLREDGRIIYAYNRDGVFYDGRKSFVDFLYWSLDDWIVNGEIDVKFIEFDENGYFKLEGYKPFNNQESAMYSFDRPLFGANAGLFIEGIGYESNKWGDWLSPYYAFSFTTNGQKYSYIGLHHMEDADGNIIYKGAAYSDPLGGDVDGSGMVDVEDVNAAVNIALKLSTAADYPGNADLDGNGMVDVEDVNALVNKILKLQ